MILLRFTGMPASRATSWLPPIAYASKPSLVFDRMNQMITKAIAELIMGPIVPLAEDVKARPEAGHVDAGADHVGDAAEDHAACQASRSASARRSRHDDAIDHAAEARPPRARPRWRPARARCDAATGR